MEKETVRITDNVVSFGDFAESIINDHDVVTMRNAILQRSVDSLLAQLEANRIRIAFLESALSREQVKAATASAMDKLAELGAKS